MICNSYMPLVFAHVVFTNTLGVCRAKDTRAWITRRMDLWERGIIAGLVGDAGVEGVTRKGRVNIGGEQEEEAVARSYHDTVFSGKLRQAVRQETKW